MAKQLRQLRDPTEDKRLKKRISFLKATGHKNIDIARRLEISTAKVRSLLGTDEVQQNIEALFNDAMESAEREFALTFTTAVKRIHTLIVDGEEATSLKAIEMLLKAQGRMQDKGPSQGMLEQMMQNQQGGFVAAGPLPPNIAENAMAFLANTPKEK